METKRPIALLTAYSAISVGIGAALIVIGFVVQARLAQLLGIDLPSTPSDYLTAAGDFATSLLVRTFAVFRGDITMTRLLLATLLNAGLAALLGMVLGRRSDATRPTSAWRRHLTRLCFVLISSAAVTLLIVTMSWLRLRNVLQPANETHAVQQFQQLPPALVEKDAAQRMIIDAYKESWMLHEPATKACFNPSTGNTAERRQNLYAGTIVVTAVLLVALLVAPRKSAGAVLHRVALTIGWAAVLVSLPLTYATLGRDFTYPVVRITQPGPPPVTYCGYLLAADAVSVTIYDRPGGFRLRRIPREHLFVDQLGTASPFQGCGSVRSDPEGFIPCENLFCTP